MESENNDQENIENIKKPSDDKTPEDNSVRRGGRRVNMEPGP